MPVPVPAPEPKQICSDLQTRSTHGLRARASYANSASCGCLGCACRESVYATPNLASQFFFVFFFPLHTAGPKESLLLGSFLNFVRGGIQAFFPVKLNNSAIASKCSYSGGQKSNTNSVIFILAANYGCALVSVEPGHHGCLKSVLSRSWGGLLVEVEQRFRHAMVAGRWLKP